MKDIYLRLQISVTNPAGVQIILCISFEWHGLGTTLHLIDYTPRRSSIAESTYAPKSLPPHSPVLFQISELVEIMMATWLGRTMAVPMRSNSSPAAAYSKTMYTCDSSSIAPSSLIILSWWSEACILTSFARRAAKFWPSALVVFTTLTAATSPVTG